MKWLESNTPLEHDCYNLIHEKDRDEVARYYLTGKLLNSKVGSRTMFTKHKNPS